MTLQDVVVNQAVKLLALELQLGQAAQANELLLKEVTRLQAAPATAPTVPAAEIGT
jgi:hypothetical protein